MREIIKTTKDMPMTGIGFTCGAFDLLHPGHLLMLEEVRSQCDYLIVGLQTDPTIDRPDKHSPIETIEERLIRLKSCRHIDGIMIYDTEDDLYVLLQNLNPDVRFLGKDWEGKEFTGFDLPIRIVYNSRDHGYSSSALRERILKQQ